MLKEARGKDVLVRINSPGGDYQDAVAIYNQLRAHRGKVAVAIDAEASSAASVVAMAGRPIRMARGSHIMIHEAWTALMGNAGVLRAAAEWLEKLSASAMDIYEERTGAERKQLAKWMAEETWFTVAEAIEAGFADEADETPAVAACRVDRSEFGQRRTPAELVGPHGGGGPHGRDGQDGPAGPIGPMGPVGPIGSEAAARRPRVASRQDQLLARVAELGPRLAAATTKPWLRRC